MALATVAELEEYLGRSLTTAEQGRAAYLLEEATDAVRRAARQHLELVVDDVASVRGVWDEYLELPQRPVVSVTEVADEDGNVLVADEDYYVYGDRLWSSGGWGGPEVRWVVTYTHGYAADEMPSDVKNVALAVAERLLTVPAGVDREQIGDYGVGYSREDARDVTRAERRRLRRYNRLRTRSSQVGGWS